MREVLFRGKAINRDYGCHRTNYKNGDWVYGLVTRLYDERFENLPAEMTNVNGIEGIEVDYKTVGQYTGLTDKNGTRIFEGDIISIPFEEDRFPYEENIVYYEKAEVYFDTEHYGWYVRYFDDDSLSLCEYDDCDITVIGNIHDNPELLKGGDESDT